MSLYTYSVLEKELPSYMYKLSDPPSFAQEIELNKSYVWNTFYDLLPHPGVKKLKNRK